MLTPEVRARIRKGMAGGRRNAAGWNRRVSGPDAVGVNGGIPDKTVGMSRDGESVLSNAGRSVMVVAVAIADVRAATIVQFDLETMTDVAGVVHGVEVVNGSVGDAGSGVVGRENQQTRCA